MQIPPASLLRTPFFLISQCTNTFLPANFISLHFSLNLNDNLIEESHNSQTQCPSKVWVKIKTSQVILPTIIIIC